MLQKLKIGIPKGSLEKATIELFKKSGWKISISSRNYFPDIDDETLSCTLIRAQEMSRYVEDGTLDLGLTGKDWIRENGSDVVVVQDLIYSKVSQRTARWVLAVLEKSPVKKLEDLQGKKITTELVRFTKDYFSERNIDVDVEFSWGATEAKVVEGLADAIVEVTETGSTLRANGLRIVQDLMETNTQLIANKASWEDTWKKEMWTSPTRTYRPAFAVRLSWRTQMPSAICHWRRATNRNYRADIARCMATCAAGSRRSAICSRQLSTSLPAS